MSVCVCVPVWFDCRFLAGPVCLPRASLYHSMLFSIYFFWPPFRCSEHTEYVYLPLDDAGVRGHRSLVFVRNPCAVAVALLSLWSQSAQPVAVAYRIGFRCAWVGRIRIRSSMESQRRFSISTHAMCDCAAKWTRRHELGTAHVKWMVRQFSRRKSASRSKHRTLGL